MKWTEITVRTTREATEAVADLFVEAGATGVVIEDPRLVEQYRDTGLWDYCDLPVSTETDVRIVGYLPMLPGLAKQLVQFRHSINLLSIFRPNNITCRVVAEEDWANSWKKYYHPLRIGTRLVIKPSWETFDAAPQDIIIELDPGMAFGTGTHATTALCLEAMEIYVKPGMSVVDVGTGSGVLAIAAAKLGAYPVRAIDADPVAVSIAKENVKINKAATQVNVMLGDLLRETTQSADIVVANIIADTIMGMARNVWYILNHQGLFIASGIINERQAEVCTTVCQAGLAVIEVKQREGWAAIIARKA